MAKKNCFLMQNREIKVNLNYKTNIGKITVSKPQLFLA